MTNKKKLGDKGEDEALQYLLGRGMLLMDRNWRHNHLELDLVMLASDGVHVVEVKTRTAPVVVQPQENVTWQKRSFLKKAASAYVVSHGIDADTHFDIVSVLMTPEGSSIEFIPDAFTQFD